MKKLMEKYAYRIEKLQEKINEIISNEASLKSLAELLEEAVTDMIEFGYYKPTDVFVEEILDLVECLVNFKIPKSYSKELLNFPIFRNLIISLQGYVLLSEDWVEPLAKWIGDRKCLEVMAGKGSFTAALKTYGVDVKATDDYSWKGVFNFNDNWTDIENLNSIDAIKKYGKDIDIVIMSWCYTDDSGYNTLMTLREVNPNASILFVGCPYGMHTGNEDLYKAMDVIDDEELDYINENRHRWHKIAECMNLIK